MELLLLLMKLNVFNLCGKTEMFSQHIFVLLKILIYEKHNLPFAASFHDYDDE